MLVTCEPEAKVTVVKADAFWNVPNDPVSPILVTLVPTDTDEMLFLFMPFGIIRVPCISTKVCGVVSLLKVNVVPTDTMTLFAVPQKNCGLLITSMLLLVR